MSVARRYPIFLQMTSFTRAWEHHGLADEAPRALEDEILLNPIAGKIIQGTGGLRKLRFASPGIPAREERRLPSLLRGFHGVRLYLPRRNLYAQRKG
jgi:hypothetical protein